MELFASKLDCGSDVDVDISYCLLDYGKLNFDTLVSVRNHELNQESVYSHFFPGITYRGDRLFPYFIRWLLTIFPF